MKKPKARRALAYLLSVTLALSTLPTSAFAEQLSDIVQDAQAQNPAAPSDGGDDSNPVPLSPTLPAPTDDAEANDEVDASANQPEAHTPQVEPQAAAAAQSVAVSGSTYTVETNDDLAQALTAIASSSDDGATIELKGGETFRVPASNYRATFGAEGKSITVTSSGDTQATLDFYYTGYLAGDCTFDNVHVKGSTLFCNGHRTVFTTASTFDFSITMYAGANGADVDSTYLVIAGTGSVNVGSTNGSHNIVGGCLAGSVHGDTYLEVSGNVAMCGGNKLTPASVLGDGTSSSTATSYVSVDGNAKLVYDNGGTGTPAIDGTSGCEIKGDLTIEARAGRCNGISAQREYPAMSIVDGSVHVIAGSPDYENTERVLRINSNWGIFGAGDMMSNFESSQYQVGGSVTVDAYENVWGWNRGTEPTRGDTPEIYGSKHADVKGNVEVNVRGSHVGNIYGADDTAVTGALSMTLTNVELKDSYYGGDYDQAGIFGLYTEVGDSSAGALSITVNGGDWALLFGTDSATAPANSTITVTGKPNIRLGVSGVQANKLPDHGVMPTVTFDGAEATASFVQECESVNLVNGSDVTLEDHDWVRGVDIEQGSTLTTTSDNHMWVYGDASIDGTWNQEFTSESGAKNHNFDLWIQGNTSVGEQGLLASKGTATFNGNVTNAGAMALMNASEVGGDYQGNKAEIRLPVVSKNYDGTSDGGDIPLCVDGTSTGSSTVYTVAADNYENLAMPEVGQNYVLSAAQDNDAPVQEVFVLGNDEAICDGLYLKRVEDADPIDHDSYHMWQIAKGDVDAISATVAPMNLTVYTGGEGYSGVIGDDGKFVSNDFPEMGFYFVLPQSINDLLGSTGGTAVNLTDKVALTYNDPSTGITRSWSLELYGNEDQSHVTMNGRKVYIYKILPSQVDGTSETIPFRVQFKDESGNVMDNTDFVASVTDQFRQFKVNAYAGGLDVSKLRITATVDGRTISRPVKLGSSTLTIRANTDEVYVDIANGEPTAAEGDGFLAGAAQDGTEYFVNDSGISAEPEGVKLMVDESLDDSALKSYLDEKMNPDGKYAYEFKYLDLVDTANGNAYVTMGEGQKMNVYWPVPEDANPNSSFKIVHFKGLDRDSDDDSSIFLESNPPETIDAEKVEIGGKSYVKFAVDSFSPFALMYQKANSGEHGGPGGQGGNAGTGDTGKGGDSGEQGQDDGSKVSPAGDKANDKKDGSNAIPQTGDETSYVAPVAAAVIGAAVAGVGMLMRRRRS